jgi:dihydropteroate synthase
VDEELRRILPFLEAAARVLPVPISVDTRNSAVAEAALEAGAAVVNDVSGLHHDPRMARVVADGSGSLVLSHMRGTPATMKDLASYGDVMQEVVAELGRSVEIALEAGVEESRIVVDPGIGFAKTAEQSLTVLRKLKLLHALGRPLMVGPSRKSFIGAVSGSSPRDRMPGTLASCVVSYLNGARIFRVHEIAPVVQALGVARAIVEAPE